MPFYSTSPAKVYCGYYSTSWEWSWRRKIIKFPSTINSETCNYTNNIIPSSVLFIPGNKQAWSPPGVALLHAS
jgi:hypothetical protein